MKWKRRDYEFRKKLAGYTMNDLRRLHKRMWAHVDKWYGSGQWDWPTFHACYPDLYWKMKVIISEIKQKVES